MLLAEMHEALHHHPFAHPGRQAAVGEANDRDVGQARQVHEAVDAGAAGEDDLEIGGAAEKIRVRLPEQRIVDAGQIAILVHGIGEVDAAAIRKGCFQDAGNGFGVELQVDENRRFCGHDRLYCWMAGVGTASMLKAAAISALV